MEFTYLAYLDMLEKLAEKGYCFANYRNWSDLGKTVIIRHDIDNSLKKAVILSKVEKDFCCEATYFVLLSTDFYNVHSKLSRQYIDVIIENGGNIGLHFDETQYCIQTEKELKEYVSMEAGILSEILGIKIDVVSMHRPSEKFLAADMVFTDIINSYSRVYFNEMKYISDSRMFWKENIDKIIGEEIYDRLHILTHPVWYGEIEKDLKHMLKESMLNASLDYYDTWNDNFRNLSEEIVREEIERVIRQ